LIKNQGLIKLKQSFEIKLLKLELEKVKLKEKELGINNQIDKQDQKKTGDKLKTFDKKKMVVLVAILILAIQKY
jgi:ABC-type phosphate transport system auxiliary subunit